MADIPAEMFEHYRAVDEGARITRGFGRLELLRTREIVRRHLPPGPLRVLDVGGATGVHAAWLAADGHRVALYDLVPEHVQEARRRTAGTPAISVAEGDARALPVADGSFDAALLFGPLYHLTERAERLAALREAKRAVRPGGPVFGAAISRFASLFDGLAREYLFDPEFREIVEADLATGQHRNPRNDPRWFTSAYLHRPEELPEECAAAGLEPVEVVGVEGVAHWLPHLAERWADPAGEEIIMTAARAIESEPAVLGVSAHLIVVARA